MADTGLPLNVPYPEPTDLVRDGAAAIQAVAEVLNAPPGAYRYAGTRYFTSTGNFEKADPLLTGDIGLRAIRVRCQGGGGGGGGARRSDNRAYAGGGGGGGGYAESFITDIAGLAGTVVATVGAGGTAGGSTSSGGTGGASSFGALVIGDGGGGGSAAANAATSNFNRGGDGGGGTGEVVFSGGPGPNASFSDFNAVHPGGGNSHLGGGAPPIAVASDGIGGVAGLVYGGGGRGGLKFDGGTVPGGGAGAQGLVAVDCFV